MVLYAQTSFKQVLGESRLLHLWFNLQRSSLKFPVSNFATSPCVLEGYLRQSEKRLTLVLYLAKESATIRERHHSPGVILSNGEASRVFLHCASRRTRTCPGEVRGRSHQLIGTNNRYTRGWGLLAREASARLHSENPPRYSYCVFRSTTLIHGLSSRLTIRGILSSAHVLETMLRTKSGSTCMA